MRTRAEERLYQLQLQKAIASAQAGDASLLEALEESLHKISNPDV